MASDDPLLRLQILQRDLVAFTESRLPNVERLAIQLDASAEDFKKLLARNRRDEKSRAVLAPNTQPWPKTIILDDIEYSIQDQFRQDALVVADELDLDEKEAANLCIRSPPLDESIEDLTLPYRALLRFHERRHALLDCLRLLLQLSLESDAEDDRAAAFRIVVNQLMQAEGGKQSERSAYWRKCIEALSDVEDFLHKIADHKQKIAMTGQTLDGAMGDALNAQRLLLTRQHECLAAILSYLIHGNYIQPEDYRGFWSKAAGLDAEIDITIHYLPVLASGAAHFGSDHITTTDIAHDLHRLFASGPGQLQWKQSNLKAVATIFWLSEYNSRFSNTSSDISPQERRNDGDNDREKLFLDCLKGKGFHFILATAAFLRPVVWYDPSRVGIIDFLMDYTPAVPADAPMASEEFSALTMREFQVFTDAFVSNMPDTLRKLKYEEDEQRRNYLSQNGNATHHFDMNLERFMVIMACAYQDDAEAARDFWSSRESNLYGFLRWASQRLPTPRVAAFCQLLRSIAEDEKSANQAHRFLLEDVGMTSSKLRKAYSVSWAQIFNELELYASSLKDRPATAPATVNQERSLADAALEEPETDIMLDSYLGLAAHICRTSPDARNWLLKDQPFHLGEVMFQLARCALVPRVRACCLDMLSALLTDKILEVRNGTWALLDNWISGGGVDASSTAAPPGRQRYSAKQYLQVFADHAEAGIALIGLLNALTSSIPKGPDSPLDLLPFPEQLGALNRNAGIDIYVDFVLDTVLAHKVPRMVVDGEASLIDLLNYQCLEFVFSCLTSFNDNLVLLANTTDVAVESAMETKSLANYVRLHPFARIMEWLLNKAVADSLFACLRQSVDTINSAETNSPLVQATLKCVQVLNLAWKLQPTWFDIVKPAIAAQSSRGQSAPSSTLTSVDDIFWNHLDVVVHIASFIPTRHVELSLECLTLLQNIGSSRKLAEVSAPDTKRVRPGSRIVGLLAQASTSLTLELQQDFIIEDWDLEAEGVPLKLIKAKAILDLLNSNLEISKGKPSIAHSLLGFDCHERTLKVPPHSAFARAASLFHVIATCAVTLPIAIDTSHTSWLLSVKRGCLDVVGKLCRSPLTTSFVRPELRSMEFIPALCQNQAPASSGSLWDWKSNLDPNILLDSSALAIRDFMHVRKAYFELCAWELRAAVEQGAFSVQEKLMSVMLGSIKLPTGEQIPTSSVYELFDFFELETTSAWDATCRWLAGVDCSGCTKDDPETVVAFDVSMAEELLILRKRELIAKALFKDTAEELQADDEIRAILASLTSQNSWAAIQNARLGALEAWTDLLALMEAKGGLGPDQAIAFSLQGLLVVLSRFEKSLVDDLDAAAQLAKLTLTLTHAVCPALRDQSQQIASVAVERLLSALRVSLKVITDSSADLALRDVCYRINCAVLESIPSVATGPSGTSSGAKQLLQLIQNAGERLLTVVTEDAFSGRGITRVSALLFLDGLVALFQGLKVNGSMLRALTKLNFVPVLIDTSIGNVSTSFQGDDELVTSLAYFHTAFALLLRLCQTTEGVQLVLDSGLYSTVEDSKLFSVDPDIGLDIDNPAALREFYAILTEILRVITAVVMTKGPQVALGFLKNHRSMVQAIYKHTSRNSGPSEIRGLADGLTRLILATGFLDVCS